MIASHVDLPHIFGTEELTANATTLVPQTAHSFLCLSPKPLCREDNTLAQCEKRIHAVCHPDMISWYTRAILPYKTSVRPHLKYFSIRSLLFKREVSELEKVQRKDLRKNQGEKRTFS